MKYLTLTIGQEMKNQVTGQMVKVVRYTLEVEDMIKTLSQTGAPWLL